MTVETQITGLEKERPIKSRHLNCEILVDWLHLISNSLFEKKGEEFIIYTWHF